MQVHLSAADKALLAASGPMGNLLVQIAATLAESITAMPAIVPETLGGANGVQGVKVTQSGNAAATIEALDADELWDVVGWALSFSAACVVTFVVDDDDVTRQFAFDIPSAGIWTEPPGSFAWFSGNIGEPMQLNTTAGNVKGIVYVRKHT